MSLRARAVLWAPAAVARPREREREIQRASERESARERDREREFVGNGRERERGRGGKRGFRTDCKIVRREEDGRRAVGDGTTSRGPCNLVDRCDHRALVDPGKGQLTVQIRGHCACPPGPALRQPEPGLCDSVGPSPAARPERAPGRGPAAALSLPAGKPTRIYSGCFTLNSGIRTKSRAC